MIEFIRVHLSTFLNNLSWVVEKLLISDMIEDTIWQGVQHLQEFDLHLIVEWHETIRGLVLTATLPSQARRLGLWLLYFGIGNLYSQALCHHLGLTDLIFSFPPELSI